MLKLRQYTKTVQAINQAGPWNQVSSATGPIALFDYPVTQSPFIDLNQCAYLNYSIEVSEIKVSISHKTPKLISSQYYLEGGS